jgi:RNA polymerase sigma-70 factor (ECF subfamily)
MKPDPSILEEHTPYMLARARRLTRNESDARDLVQDTHLQALEALARMEIAPDNLRAWLSTVMRHHWLDHVRHRRVDCDARFELTNAKSVDFSLSETRAVRSQLARAWDQLTEQAQGIAAQCLIDGDSQEEVSRRFGITANGVATSIHRTRAQLRRALFAA